MSTVVATRVLEMDVLTEYTIPYYTLMNRDCISCFLLVISHSGKLNKTQTCCLNEIPKENALHLIKSWAAADIQNACKLCFHVKYGLTKMEKRLKSIAKNLLLNAKKNCP